MRHEWVQVLSQQSEDRLNSCPQSDQSLYTIDTFLPSIPISDRYILSQNYYILLGELLLFLFGIKFQIWIDSYRYKYTSMLLYYLFYFICIPDTMAYTRDACQGYEPAGGWRNAIHWMEWSSHKHAPCEYRALMERERAGEIGEGSCPVENCEFQSQKYLRQLQNVESHHMLFICDSAYFTSFRDIATKHSCHNHCGTKTCITQVDE